MEQIDLMHQAAHRLDQVAGEVPKSPWNWTGAYPQTVLNGEVKLIAQVYENPDTPASVAPYLVMMQPLVAERLAEWLRDAADEMAKSAVQWAENPENTQPTSQVVEIVYAEALGVARAVLGMGR